MSIYVCVVALWFMAIALFLIGASIRAWFRSPRPVIDPRWASPPFSSRQGLFLRYPAQRY